MLLVRCAANWHDTHIGSKAESPSPTGKGEAGVNRPARWCSIPDTAHAMPLIRQWGGNWFSVHILRDQRSLRRRQYPCAKHHAAANRGRAAA